LTSGSTLRCFHLCNFGTSSSSFFFFTYPATTKIYTLSLHDALPISSAGHLLTREAAFSPSRRKGDTVNGSRRGKGLSSIGYDIRSEEHTSELQSRGHLVCRLLLEKKKKT